MTGAGRGVAPEQGPRAVRGCLAAALVLVGLLALLPGLCTLSFSHGSGGFDLGGGGLITIAIACVGGAFVLLLTRGPD